MKSQLASLILFTSIISVTQICCAGETKYAPNIQARKATVSVPAIEKKQETRDSTASGKPHRGGTLVSGAGHGGSISR